MIHFVVCVFQMEEEEHTDRKQQLAMLFQKLNKIKKYLNEGKWKGLCIRLGVCLTQWISMTIIPCLFQTIQTTSTMSSAQTRLNLAWLIWWIWRRKGILTWTITISPASSTITLKCSPTCRWGSTVRMRAMPGCWLGLQSLKRKLHLFSTLSMSLHLKWNSWKVHFLLVRIQDVNEAEANFNVARSHSPNFAFVHIAHARFEHSRGVSAVYFHFFCL